MNTFTPFFSIDMFEEIKCARVCVRVALKFANVPISAQHLLMSVLPTHPVGDVFRGYRLQSRIYGKYQNTCHRVGIYEFYHDCGRYNY